MLHQGIHSLHIGGNGHKDQQEIDDSCWERENDDKDYHRILCFLDQLTKNCDGDEGNWEEEKDTSLFWWGFGSNREMAGAAVGVPGRELVYF